MYKSIWWCYLIVFACKAEANRSFPDGFMFGVATAAYQIEGAWNEDGKGENIWDYMIHNNRSTIANNDTADVACDSYHKYKEDVELIAGLNLTHYRFSISWSRVLPAGFAYKINEKGIEYYKNLVKELLAHNIQPVVTLYHWDLPEPLQEIGGWTNPDMVKYFKEYARIVIESLPEVQYWATFNEPKQVCRAGYGVGSLAPKISSDGIADYICPYVIVKSHAEVYRMYKNEFPELKGKMSIVLDGQWAEPASNSSDDLLAAERKMHFEFGIYANPIFLGDWPQVVKERVDYRSENENFTRSRLPVFTKEEVDFINGTFDYLGFNHYYTRLAADAEESPFDSPGYDKDVRVVTTEDPDWDRSPNGNPIVPWGIRRVLNWIRETYGDFEIFITENGVIDDGSTLEDNIRIDYYEGYLNSVLDAMHEDKVNVVGFTAWSLMDNFEWTGGYGYHFGLYSVDFTDPERPRKPKKSVEFYRKLATTRVIPNWANEISTSWMCSILSLIIILYNFL
ncbi:hypothetical protein NQ315_006880 [Exocentrus adspersus]|uniref:Myrosinase 1 n=1 Tax=Exocentrus adspersus TaxID=1586481 RepID=A0AAV8WBV3_9CUCU|nr:hypothetical protein NQ315_006880 [Exocentrus adspersus]